MPGFAELSVASTWDGTAIGPDEQVHLRLNWDERTLTIEVDAPFHDDPPPSSWRLWEHEVVELFVAHGEAYTEIELSPLGEHLVLRFQGYRNRTEARLPIEFSSKVDGARWRGVAEVKLRHLPAEPWTINAYAIHGEPRRFLAWAPGEGEPDFHRLETFRGL
ncbi:MAG: hypothetical protein GY898_00730 [Proteobacteria bacterium]|nr:hypothetical protein [Pseudomonadota bacterium]